MPGSRWTLRLLKCMQGTDAADLPAGIGEDHGIGLTLIRIRGHHADLKTRASGARHTQIRRRGTRPRMRQRQLFENDPPRAAEQVLEDKQISLQRQLFFGSVKQPLALLDQLVVQVGSILKLHLREPHMLRRNAQHLQRALAAAFHG